MRRESTYGQLFAGTAFSPSPSARSFPDSFTASGVAADQRVVPHFALSQLPPRVWNSPAVRTGQVHCALVGSLESITQGWSSQAAQGVPAGQLIAGWMVIDVESWDRAKELASELSAAPGPDGKPIHEWLEVRPFLTEMPNSTVTG